jgi:integrase/recombinase XerD
LCKLAVRDIHDRQGVTHFRVHGKGSKIRYIPLHPIALQRIQEYLIAAGHAEDTAGPLFRPVKNPSEKGDISHALTHPAIYHCVLRKYARAIGIGGGHLGPHSLRATAATNALDRGSDLARSKSGWDTLTSPQPASMIVGVPGPKTAPLTAFRIEADAQILTALGDLLWRPE